MSRHLAILVLALALVAPASASAELGAPNIGANARRDGTVHIRWTYAGVVRELTTLRLERSDNGGPFSPLTVLSQPKRRGTYVDTPSGSGAFVYQARIEGSGQASPWNSTSVTIAAPAPPPPPPPSSNGQCPAGSEAQVLTLVNRARTQNRVAPLADNAKLDTAASNHTEYMVESGLLSHTPAGFPTWYESIRQAGYSGSIFGQNIAYGYRSASAVVSGWLASSGHRANILNPSYRDSGVGCLADAGGRLWWTQDFGG